jgi:hypothetical protein
MGVATEDANGGEIAEIDANANGDGDVDEDAGARVDRVVPSVDSNACSACSGQDVHVFAARILVQTSKLSSAQADVVDSHVHVREDVNVNVM